MAYIVKCEHCKRDLEFKDGIIIKLCRCGHMIEDDSFNLKGGDEICQEKE